MSDYSPSELIAHQLGMQACMAGCDRSRNPYDNYDRGPMDFQLCRAWFTGWDDANRGLKLIKEKKDDWGR